MAMAGGSAQACGSGSVHDARRLYGFGPSAEGLIGFKLQALDNHSSRTRDLDDIRALLRAQRGRLSMPEVREYFALFDRTEMLDELLAEIAHEPT